MSRKQTGTVHFDFSHEGGKSEEEIVEELLPDARPKSRSALRSRSRSQSAIRSRSELLSNPSGLSKDVEELEEGVEKASWCWSWSFCCSGSGFFYCLYVLVFVGFLIFFPLFLKWMITAPKPQQFWYQELEHKGFKFPQLIDWKFVRHELGNAYKIHLSDIPQTWSGCNHSCSAGGGFLRSRSDMNFQVDVKLEAPGLEYTAHPLLLASNDFGKWWVAADRRHGYPQRYFESNSADKGSRFSLVTDPCTRPPEILPGKTAALVDRYSTSPMFVLTCVTWTKEKAFTLRKMKSMAGKDIGQLCDAVGGVCGWPCGANPKNMNITGCSSDGMLQVSNDLGRVAGVSIPDANFSGNVTVRACLPSPSSGKCITSADPIYKWQCHMCQNTTENITMQYQSLPRMELSLKDASVGQDLAHSMDPQAFVFTSPLAADGSGPAGMQGGTWDKLYDPDLHPAALPVDELKLEPKKKFQAWETTTTSPPPVIDVSQHTMRFSEGNKVTIEPSWCFGRRGPLYLVACALNSSTYENNFEFKQGQEVAGPPFNDRCLTVTGRCAYACQEMQSPMPHCDAEGFIDQSELVKFTETKKNDSLSVYAFLITLLVGFAVKILAYVPGLFIPYARAKYYSSEMTAHLKYIAVCTPSGGETKACVLRNLVGAMSSLPTDCACPFHVLFADEGHRHPQKIMFRVYVKVMASVPSVRMTDYNSKKLKHGYKEENLKAFTSAWVEATKKLLLEDCSTEKLVQKISKLAADGNPENADAIGKLNSKIDALCGKTALKIMQDRKGWPKAGVSSEVAELESAILQLRKELTIGEKKYDGKGTERGGERDQPKSVNLDDCEAYGWVDEKECTLYTLHYVARAKPDEDERTLAVQHIARGTWCYRIPKTGEGRTRKSWLEWRQRLAEFQLGEELNDSRFFMVPIRTSRGKAGGLNFAENYLFDFHKRKHETEQDDGQYKHGLFSIADARHQYQSDFFLETIPYFFRTETELNPRVAFTQCPQYFQEMPDDADYLDTNNSSFFRMGCMLRNCCGGVSSCGTNGTWLIRDRRAGLRGEDSMWELEEEHEMEQGFTQVVERRFFHESCKVEDTASSLDRVVKGKYSHYINMRLSYGMAKEPTDFLAAVQRWAEGGVVLSLQTFFGSEQGVYMVWMAFLLFILFIVSTFFLTFSFGTATVVGSIFNLLTGDDRIMDSLQDRSLSIAHWFVEIFDLSSQSVEDYQEMFHQTVVWTFFLAISIFIVWFVTLISYYCHHCLGWHRTRFPTSLAQWARLLITVDNLTYFLWFWTAFFWVGFNYYSAWSVKDYNFDPVGMTLFMWILQILSWSMLLSASSRYVQAESRNANEIFSLTLTNIWRTTQMFYITAPLTLFSIIMGFSDFLRNRMFGQDISYWVGGDRGKLSKLMVQYWTLFLVVGMLFTWFAYNVGWLPDERNALASVIIVTVIGFDVMHPCAFLWLGTQREKLPAQEEVKATGLSGMLQRCCRRHCQLLVTGAFYRNLARSILFSSRCTGLVKWIGPLQHVVLPILTLFLPELGINQVLLLVTAVK